MPRSPLRVHFILQWCLRPHGASSIDPLIEHERALIRPAPSGRIVIGYIGLPVMEVVGIARGLLVIVSVGLGVVLVIRGRLDGVVKVVGLLVEVELLLLLLGALVGELLAGAAHAQDAGHRVDEVPVAGCDSLGILCVGIVISI